MDLNIEIEEYSRRIESRQLEIEGELNILSNRIIKYTSWAWIFVWFGVALSIFSIIYYCCTDINEKFGLNLLGDFMAGAVASVWSLAGLFLIYVAFIGQKQQLLNQQMEIMYSQLEVRYTRLELAGQKEEMIEQNKTLRQQRFENTFFQLLSLFSSVVNSLDLRSSKTQEVIASGRDCFEIFYIKLRANLKALNRNNGETYINLIMSAYDQFYDASKSDMSHYFRTLYHIIKFIDNSEIENKRQYASIVRAQLSSYEQVLIFYNCLNPIGFKFKPLIEKYAIFKNLDQNLLFNEEDIIHYLDTAYGK